MNNLPKRGNLSPSFIAKLTEGEYAPLLKTILEDTDLDMQLRDKYINVYYRGGNILRICYNSCQFDKFYFYNRNIEGISRPFPKGHIEKVAKGKPDKISSRTIEPIPTKDEALQIISLLDAQCRELIKLLETDASEYFKQAKRVMDEWFEFWNKQERNDQHIIALSNRMFSDQSDLVVVDLEFAVSRYQPYNQTYKANGEKKVCRFDIIAVDQKGRIYVIELKQNDAADSSNNKANVTVHTADFDDTIGSDTDNAFAEEISDLVETKKALHILSQDIFVDKTKRPIFAVAYSGQNPKRFNAKYRAAGLTVITVTTTTPNHLYLKL